MKVLNKIKIAFYLLLLLILFSSCEKDTKTDYESFLIQVDSIEVSNTITANTSFDISFYGTVGTNGCYEFSHFLTEKTNNEILIEALGNQDVGANICASVMVYLNGENLNYLIEESGDYLIRIKQPDNSFLEKEISVE